MNFPGPDVLVPANDDMLARVDESLPAAPAPGEDLLTQYMAESRALAVSELKRLLPKKGSVRSVLYDRMLEYPLRAAKALRPALCIATCRALGGPLEGVLSSAAVLELYHNAFLIHDDVEDGSDKRRNGPTLHRAYGVPIAINVGDAMLAAALEPLLDNMAVLGMGKALRILKAVAVMARESAEGQALELEWVRSGHFGIRDAEYLRMVHKKTSYYSFLAPMELGALVAGANDVARFRMRRFATLLGSAFQIQDDILNLRADDGRYGKERFGDLWEGKHTLILAHALRVSSDLERRRAIAILKKQRPASAGLDAETYRTEEDVEELFALIERTDSLSYARSVATTRALRARRALESLDDLFPPSVHQRFLAGLVDFVVDRDH